MGVFLAILIMLTTGSVALFVIVRTHKKRDSIDSRTRLVISHLTIATVLVLSDILCGGQSLTIRLPFDMLISLFPMMIVTSSVLEEGIAFRISQALTLPVCMAVAFYILQKIGFRPMFPASYYLSLTGFVTILICLLFLYALVMRMREIRLVMKSGNVWSSVCFTIDVLYLFALVIYVIALLVSMMVSIACAEVVAMVVSLLLACELVALGLRVSFDSLFLIWRKHERRIVESMRISQTDVTHDSSKINEMYKQLYVRLVALFEEEKPFLDSELTINDIVKVTFTNKLYISRAISQFTGRNFCQFVNYYRVTHSIQMFRDNPEMKVIDLATQCGFNSTVSYSMAFRLFMGESPSDWCRKEKVKLIRRKK